MIICDDFGNYYNINKITVHNMTFHQYNEMVVKNIINILCMRRKMRNTWNLGWEILY
ncbi:hypothetical protein HMPREF1584_00230 [Gardnerella vaginalis JCP8481A]|nr:hypothetical protein HMPREF1584_00230 [Gardnerella vaginalis JCP8481A]